RSAGSRRGGFLVPRSKRLTEQPYVGNLKPSLESISVSRLAPDRARSSVDQSEGLLIPRSQVRILPGPLESPLGKRAFPFDGLQTKPAGVYATGWLWMIMRFAILPVSSA